MMYLTATLHLMALRTLDSLKSQLAPRAEPGLHGRGQRGSVTIEQVLWAVALIAMVAIAVAAIKTFVTDKAAEIK